MQRPAGLGSSSPLLLFEKIHGEAAIAFRKFRPLGIRKEIVFEATYPRPTRSRAYASPISLPRSAPGSLPARAGSPLAGRDLHPLDSESKFHEVIAPPFPFDQQSLVASIRLIRCAPGGHFERCGRSSPRQTWRYPRRTETPPSASPAPTAAERLRSTHNL